MKVVGVRPNQIHQPVGSQPPVCGVSRNFHTDALVQYIGRQPNIQAEFRSISVQNIPHCSACSAGSAEQIALERVESTMSIASAFLQYCARSVALFMAVHSATAFAGSNETMCEAQSLKVVASLAQDAADACRGAKDAIDFFTAAQLKTDIHIEIHVQDALPPGVSPNAAGCFLQTEGKILLRPYASFRKYKTWFNVPIDRHLYRSLAAHEMAHALGACNFTIQNPSIQAKEYVAYVTMFSTMDAALRARILKASPDPGSRNPGRLTALLYMFEPMRFGVEAYRHHLSPENGRSYLREVLAGKALAD